MRTDVLKAVLTLGIKTTSEIANGFIGLLPEETGQKMKFAGTSLLKMVHEVTGDMIDGEESVREADKSTAISITIE